MTPHEWLAVIEALAGLALFLCGRYLWPSRRAASADAYDRGWDDHAAELDSDRMLPSVRPPLSAAEGPDADDTRDMPWRWAGRQARRAQPPGEGPRTSEPTAAELELARQQHGHIPIEGPLSPAQERAAIALDLPGPEDTEAAAFPPQRALSADRASGRAGGLHYRTALPAVLMLGQPGDGSDKTATRVYLDGMSMLTRFEQEQAEYCRRSGIEWRGLVVAA